jgi:thymidylate synthase ThyX
MSDEKNSPPIRSAASPAIEVYAVYGAEPEVQAYAMAKYSRSALSMKESLRELNEQKAERFLNTFYFQYGHRSIADLAHIAIAVEKLSILAAIALLDEARWDGQERSTRYQDFSRPNYYVPDFGDDGESQALYHRTIEFLFSEYRDLFQAAVDSLRASTPRPKDMAAEQYERTLRARAFDVARYLLPLATNTSLGQIVNARTLENQISRLLSHRHSEVRMLGALLKQSARQPAYNPNETRYRRLVEEAAVYDERWAKQLGQELLKPVRVAPTLVKYADPNPYAIETGRELSQAEAELMRGAQISGSEDPVDLLEDEPLEIEVATTLLYEHSHYSYRMIRERVAALPENRRDEIIAMGTRHRGAHDELLRPFCAGQKFRFDILMDIGGYRDLHRHRRCIQVGQDFTTRHGYDTPDEVHGIGWDERYGAALARACESSGSMTTARAPECDQIAQYLLPLGLRKRTLFKMDFAEAVYIAELRTGPGGHISYRRIAYQMYQAVARKHPSLAKIFRVHDVNQPVDLLQR